VEQRQPSGSLLSRQPVGHCQEERQAQGPWQGGFEHVTFGHFFLLSSHSVAD
jgi:hypothetical protein